MRQIFSLPGEIRSIIFSYTLYLPNKTDLIHEFKQRKARWEYDNLKFVKHPLYLNSCLSNTNTQFILTKHDRTNILKVIDCLLILNNENISNVSYLYALLSQNYIYNARNTMKYYKDFKNSKIEMRKSLYYDWLAL